MFMFLPLIIFAFGLLIGSFLNVVILRLNTGRSIVTGRSKCARCDRTLKWYELVPVFSFVGLRGKCNTCTTPISFQYPLVELVTAIAFTVLYNHFVVGDIFSSFAWLAFVFAATVASLLIVILAYDVRHKIIPDLIVYLFIGMSLVSILYQWSTVPGFSVLSALFGGVLAALIFFLLWFFSKGRAMGFGDVKLGLGVGWLLGLQGGLAAVMIAFWVGAVVGLLMIAISRRYRMHTQVPFAPFLIIATGIVVLYGVTLSTIFPLW